jgi:hypothetical protein
MNTSTSSRDLPTTIVEVKTDSPIGDNSSPGGQTIFDLAAQVEKILHGHSNKDVMKILNLVGSIHGIRSIPVDRPIGQSTAGTVRTVPVVKAVKGKSTPKAAYKQTTEYIQLSASRDELVRQIKSIPDTEAADRLPLVDRLRSLELKLKQFKSAKSGDR